MNILMIGVSHKTAPIDIREQFYLTETERELLLSTLQSDPSIAEAIVLSTCNRTEVYANVIKDGPSDILVELLFKMKNLPPDHHFRKHFYVYRGRDAVRHLFRVSTGLESIILGERQILGQVKAAGELARKRGMLGKSFNVLSGLAVRTGKKAQNETRISEGGVSVSWAAVTMAKQMLGSFEDKSVLIIGTGKMGQLAVNHLSNKGVGEIYVMNRSSEKAKHLAAKFNGIPVSFWDVKEILRKVDVCFVSTGAPHYIVEKQTIEEAFQGIPRKKLLCVDISIPRNIEPSVADIDGVALITIDNLGDVVAQNMERRYSALTQVEDIVSKKLDQFENKMSKIQLYEQIKAPELTS